MTFFKNLPSNSLPTGKSFQSIATKFPHPGLHIAVHPKAGPKKGTIKISPNKTLQSLFINVTASPKIHVPVKAAIIRFNHSIRVLIHWIEYRNFRRNSTFCKFEYTVLSKGYKESEFYKIYTVIVANVSHTLINCTCKHRLGFSLLPFTLIPQYLKRFN